MIAVLGSGDGESLQILAAETDVGIVVSNKADAGILGVAEGLGIEAKHIPGEKGVFERKVMGLLDDKGIGIVACLEFSRILSKEFDENYRVLSSHPSLLPELSGITAKESYKQAIEKGLKETGITIHIVDEGVDTGKVLLQEKITISPNETVESLRRKLQKVEGRLMAQAINMEKPF